MKTSICFAAVACAVFLINCPASASANSWPERFRIDKRAVSKLQCSSTCASDAGQPLYLTPYINSGKIQEGRSAAAVKGLPGAGAAHGGFSGFLTVNETTGSNTFFWYFPPLNGNASAPTLLWLQGGPGSSSLFGLFYEIGPFFVTSDLNLVPNANSWNNEHGLLFFDNPINTGFSFSSDDDGYARSSDDYSSTLYEAIRQFYLLFPELQSNALVITGESYAGKYVPAMALRIAEENAEGNVPRVPLAGIAVGDGLVDPLNMVTGYPDLVYQFGLADSAQKSVLESYATNFASAVKSGDNLEAYRQFDLMINGDTLGPSYYTNITQIGYFRCCAALDFDYDDCALRRQRPAVADPLLSVLDPAYADQNNFYGLLNSALTRASIHVGNLSYNDGNIEVEKHLLQDVAASQMSAVIGLLDTYHISVLFYNGNLDIIVKPLNPKPVPHHLSILLQCGAPLTARWIDAMQWSGSAAMASAERWACCPRLPERSTT